MVKMSSTGTQICSNSWDATTGVVNSIAYDAELGLVYVVGSGCRNLYYQLLMLSDFTPLEIENAPYGLLVATSYHTIDAAIIAFNISDCTRYYSSITRFIYGFLTIQFVGEERPQIPFMTLQF